MKLSSPSFENQGNIPQKFTCDGEDVSPALEWSGAPEGSETFVLIVDDPDAPDPANPRMTWFIGFFTIFRQRLAPCRKG